MGISNLLTKTLRLHPSATAYAATALGTAFMDPVFKFYYVKIFLERYSISQQQFQIAQVIYMIWNSLNDPLFGYFQDNCNHFLVRTRRHTIMYGAPIWALSFLVPWFPWADYQPGDWMCGLHLIVSLCFYDAMFTYVLLANNCVLAEACVKYEDRLRCVQYQSIASLIGSLSVFVCEFFSSHLENYFVFQICCVVLSILAWQSIAYTGRHGVTLYDLNEVNVETDGNALKRDEKGMSSQDRSTDLSIFRLTWQIVSNMNFTWYVLANLLNEFHVNFIMSFVSIISDALIPKEYMPLFLWNIYYGSVYIIPRIVFITTRRLLTSIGYYRISRVLYGSKVILGSSMFLIGSSYPGLFIVFCLCDGLLTSYLGYLMMMPLSDVVDEDMRQHNRKHPMSSMVFGTNALITKPGISLAPMFVVYVLNQYGYQEYKSGELGRSSAMDLKNVMFLLSCSIPVIVGLIQSFFWTKFKIRNSHSNIPKYNDT